MERYPGSAAAPEALLEIARLRLQAGSSGEAEETARSLIARYPVAPATAGALLLVADLEAERAGVPAALAAPRQTLDELLRRFPSSTYPGLEARVAARVRLAELAWLAGDDRQAAGLYVAAVEDQPAAEWRPRARTGLARLLLADGRWQAAAGELQAILDEAPDSAAAATARRHLTLIHRLLLRPAAGEERWTSARRVQPTGATLERPTGLAADDAGRLVVVDEARHEVVLLDPEGRLTDRLAGTDVARPAWGGEGGAALAPAPDRVLEVPGPAVQAFFDPSKSGQEALGGLVAVTRGAFGHWTLLTRRGDRVLRFVRDGGFLATLAAGPDPVDLAVDERGELYVLERKGGQVLRFANNGAALGVAASGAWKRPQAIALDALGDLYVLDRGADRIEIFGPQGERLTTLGPALPGGLVLDNPQDLAVDGRGRIFVADPKLGGVVVIE